jgi:fructose-1,6-bisphosphatase/inositol monophosphatase family enzyme
MTAMSLRVYAAAAATVPGMGTVSPEPLQQVLRDAAAAVRSALDELADWGLAKTRPGQYRSDLAADRAALDVLRGAGLAVLSEESGVTGDGPLVAVLDPVDGSTNASRGIPWFATSICVVDGDGPLAAIVVNQALGTTYEAVREGGATRDGRPIAPGPASELSRAVVGLSGYPPRHLGWRQYRALGAAALDLCAVADGTLDAYVDCGSGGGHGVWDYLGGQLICEEAGAFVADADGRELVTLEHDARRAPVAAACGQLLAELIDRRRAAFEER